MTINNFQLHDTTTAPAASAEILNRVQKTWGFVPNLHRVLAESPAALEAYAALRGIAEKTSFTAGAQRRVSVYHLRERVRLLHGRPQQPVAHGQGQ
jgi:hypothetical protein